MQKFTYYAPTEVVFGKGAERNVAEEIKKWNGSRIMLIYGGSSVKKSGLLERIKNTLSDAGLSYQEFGGVKPNPRLSFAEEGIRCAVAFKADFVLAVGGGSVIDTAKAIAVGACYSEYPLWDIWTNRVKVDKALPVGCVLTIAAAGSEMSSSAVLTNEEIGKKSGFGSEYNRPKFAILNPELTFTLPKYQIACGVADILMHTLERYFLPNQEKNQLTDEIAEGLMRTVIENGSIAYQNPNDYDAMSEIMWCSSLSHNDLTGLGRGKDFTVHKFGHELSAKYDVAHGASLAAMWSTWARYVCHLDYERFARFGEKVWGIHMEDVEKAAHKTIDRMEEYFISLDLPVCLGQLSCGILSKEELEDLALRTTNQKNLKIGVFQVLDYEQVYDIYQKANHL